MIVLFYLEVQKYKFEYRATHLTEQTNREVTDQRRREANKLQYHSDYTQADNPSREQIEVGATQVTDMQLVYHDLEVLNDDNAKIKDLE